MDTAKKRIMIVDDDKEFLEEFEAILSYVNYEVTTASDGDSACPAH